jgi:hypothetical protein
MKSSNAVPAPRIVKGRTLPPKVSLVSHGAAMKKAKVIRTKQTFWTVKFCTLLS